MGSFDPVQYEQRQIRVGVDSVVSPWGAPDMYGSVLLACIHHVFFLAGILQHARRINLGLYTLIGIHYRTLGFEIAIIHSGCSTRKSRESEHGRRKDLSRPSRHTVEDSNGAARRCT